MRQSNLNLKTSLSATRLPVRADALSPASLFTLHTEAAHPLVGQEGLLVLPELTVDPGVRSGNAADCSKGRHGEVTIARNPTRPTQSE